MYFNSIDFAIFLPVVLTAYWFIASGSLRQQNLLIVIASYVFYGWWDWRFLFLIFFSSVSDYLIGIGLSKQDNLVKRKFLLWTSVVLNLGLLAFFKYYNFFLDNIISAFSFFGTEITVDSLKIILPIGISFYTFQSLGYSIDVYLRKIEATRDLVAFIAFVSFFPQLVAGPIERATNLLPQFYRRRTFDYSDATDGMRQVLWGLFKKIVVADNCALYADTIFNNSVNYSGMALVFGAIFFAFQIYGDFSGYSDIAIGTSRLFGFNLLQNFNFPYFSRNIAEFWRRWHISLTTWFRDYLYVPLGGSRHGTLVQMRNTFIIFMVGGFWHGANWTFIIWGLLNAFYFLPLLLCKKNRDYLETVGSNNLLPSLKELLLMIITFCLTTFAWIFFRAKDISHALQYVSGVLDMQNFWFEIEVCKEYSPLLLLIAIFVVIEWLGRNSRHALEKMSVRLSRPLRFVVYYSIILAIFWLGGREREFLYFQF